MSEASFSGQLVDGRYRIGTLLGRGGMGEVYRAEHVKLRRPLAIKFLSSQLRAYPDVAARFEREAMATARIDHPNCVGVTDCGHTDDGTIYLVMELLDGRSLSDVIDDDGALAPVRALSIMRQILRGLAHAHGSGVVHRDIKPDNIVLVDTDEQPDFVKLLDFGIAKLIGDAVAGAGKDLTGAGIAIGTPTYMAPEQAFGSGIDERADLYAASVVLYEMLTGEPPFRSDDRLEVLSMHASAEPPSLVAQGVPPAVAELVVRGLAKRKQDRFATAAEYAAAVDAVLAQLAPGWPRASTFATPVEGTPVTPMSGQVSGPVAGRWQVPSQVPSRARGWTRRRVAVACGAAAVLLGLIFFAARSARLRAPVEAAAHPEAGPLLARGHEQHDGGAVRAGLRSYREAVRVHPGAYRDETLQLNLRRAFDAHDEAVVDEALTVVRAAIASADSALAGDQLVGLASSHPRLYTRYRAFSLAEELGLGARIDRLQAYLLDLEQSPRCEHRRRTVVKLQELGDPRAIEPLQKARRRMRKTGPLNLRTVNTNGCLVEEVDRAIRALRGE